MPIQCMICTALSCSFLNTKIAGSGMLSATLRQFSRNFVTVIDNRNRRFLFSELMHDRMYGYSSADVCATNCMSWILS